MSSFASLLQPVRRTMRHSRKHLRMWLLNREAPMFVDPDAFIGKRIIIVAPGDSVDADMREVDLADFDHVVRMNRLTNASATGPGVGDRARTDILFHNLKFGGRRGAGDLETDELTRQGTSLIIFPHATEDFVSRKVIAEIRKQRHRLDLAVKMPPFDFYSSLRQDLKGLRPTTGTVAAAFFMSCRVEHLMLAGFTFFRTPYKAGYTDRVRTDAEARQWGKDCGQHDPERERLLLRDRIVDARAQGRTISLAPNVERHLSSD